MSVYDYSMWVLTNDDLKRKITIDGMFRGFKFVQVNRHETTVQVKRKTNDGKKRWLFFSYTHYEYLYFNEECEWTYQRKQFSTTVTKEFTISYTVDYVNKVVYWKITDVYVL